MGQRVKHIVKRIKEHIISIYNKMNSHILTHVFTKIILMALKSLSYCTAMSRNDSTTSGDTKIFETQNNNLISLRMNY